jgi:transposase-like protein
VFGMIERDGELRVGVVSDMKAKTVSQIIGDNVEKGATIMTDQHPSFVGLSGDYWHHAVNYSAGEYVRHQTIHTNSIESVWALLKMQTVVIHHWVSLKHLQRYVDEMTWRFNRRDMRVAARMNDLSRAN